MKRISSLILFFFISALLKAQNKGIDSFYHKRIEIKKSFENKIDRQKPAAMSFTLPAGEKRYYTVNGGILLSFGKAGIKTATDWNLFGVYNKNNQLKKEQDNYKLGFGLSKSIYFFKSPGMFRRLRLRVELNSEYLKNKIDTTKSFLTQLYVSPVFSFKKFKIGLPVNDYKNDRWAPLFDIVPGVEYQNKFDVPLSAFKGSLARLYLATSFDLYYKVRAKANDPATDLVNLVQTNISYIYRRDFANNTGKWEGYQPLFNFTLAFYPFKNDNISFGATYTKGADPLAAQEKQEFWQFQFKFLKDIKAN